MVKAEGRQFVEPYPAGVVSGEQFGVILSRTKQRVIGYRHHALSGVASDLAEGVHLLHIHVFQAREFAQHAAAGVVNALAFLHKATHHRPLALLGLEIPLGEEQTQPPLDQAEDYTVDGDIKPRIFTVEVHVTRSRYRMLL